MRRRVTAKLSAKSQLVVPKLVREQLGLRAGDTVEFEERDGVFVLRPLRPHPDDPFAVFTEWCREADERAYGEL